MYKTLELTLDTERTNNTKTNAQNFLVNTNDYESVKIIADIVQDKEQVDLTDATVKLAIRKPDQTIVFQDGTVTATIEGECEFVLETQSYVLKGTHVAEVMIYFADGKIVVTRAFAYHVAEGILSDTAIESTSWYQDVNELQLAVQELQVEVDAFIATAVEETRAEITAVDTRLTSQLADKVSQAEALTLLGGISDGTPLFASSTAGMTDTTRNYVNTTDGLLYTHNGTAWVSTGVPYQATGIADRAVTANKLGSSIAVDKKTLTDPKYVSLTSNTSLFILNKPLQKGVISASFNSSTASTGAYIFIVRRASPTSDRFSIVSYEPVNVSIGVNTIDTNLYADGTGLEYFAFLGFRMKYVSSGGTTGYFESQNFVVGTENVQVLLVGENRPFDFACYITYANVGLANAFSDQLNTVAGQSNPYQNLNILHVGDSLTEGDYGSDPSGTKNVKPENYPYFMQKYLGNSYQNAGKSGYTALMYWNNTAQTLDYTDKDIMIIMLGTNVGLTDTLVADTTITEGQTYLNYANTNTGAYCKIIEHAYAQSGGKIQIILATPPYVGDRRPSNKNAALAARPVVFKIAEKYNLPVIDMNQAGFNKVVESVMQPIDGLHFGLLGYKKLGTFIGSQVKSLASFEIL